MNEDCIFCKIGRKELSSEVIYEHDDYMVFKDIHPKAPIHWVVIPTKIHLRSIQDASDDSQLLLGKMILVAKEATRRNNVNGYKLVFNVGREGGQVIDHVHLHILGGWGKGDDTNVRVGREDLKLNV